MSNRSMVIPILFVIALCLMASPAYASAPPTTPAVIQKVTFESSSDASDTLKVDTTQNLKGATTSSTWGAVTSQHLGGTHGFWCAGSTPAAWPAYPAGTHGLAYVRVADASDWAESEISFSYIEPSVGGLDTYPNPFVPGWVDGSQAATASYSPLDYSDPFLPTSPTWRTITLTRGGSFMPSMNAGWLRFDFTSYPNQSSTGQGVTIDDISVSGFEFDAPNSLAAARQSGSLSTVVVTWTKPSAPGSSNPDPRDIYYRVWRHDLDSNSWAELTTVRSTDTSFTDTAADISHVYTYAVQGYEASGETAWGRLAVSATVDKAIPHFLDISADKSTVSYGGTSTISASLVDAMGAAISSQSSSVVLQESSNGGGTWADTSAPVIEPSPGLYSAVSTSNADTTYRFLFTTTGATSASTLVNVVASHFLGISSGVGSVPYGGTTTISASLVDGFGAALGSQTSVLLQQSWDGGATWQDMGAVVSETSPGTYAASAQVLVNTRYRLSYPYGGPTNAASPSVLVSSGTYLSVPTTSPSKPTHNKTFSVRGSVSGIPVATRSITLKAYRKETKTVKRKKTTVWVLRGTVVARLSQMLGVGPYNANMKLKLAGSYRLYASVSDSYSTPVSVGYRGFTVK